MALPPPVPLRCLTLSGWAWHRLSAAGIPSPEPILLKSHVLIMRFLGTNGKPHVLGM
jgi:hypothetical protein